MSRNLDRYQEMVSGLLDDLSIPSEPANLYEPIKYILSLGGKRLRPTLALMGHEVFDENIEASGEAALAVEIFHNFSLIHDDIMDEAPLRRGKETVHKKWNQNVAILSGDVMLVQAYEQLSAYSGTTLNRLLEIFNRTAIEVCNGQQLDMDFEERDEVSIDEYLEMIRLKTAVLLGCSLKMGGIVADGPSRSCDKLYEFGVHLGIAFQLQDDILDVYAEGEQFGKQVGGDIISNKKTYLLLKAFEDANDSQKSALTEQLSNPNATEKVRTVMAIYDELQIREKATEKMMEYHELALKNLEDINVDEEHKAPLKAVAAYLSERAH